MSDILIFMSGILIYMIRFGIFFMIMYGMLFVISPAAVFWLPFLIYWRPTIDVLLLTSFITYPSCVAIHITITLQVFFQYSGIRLGHALQFASPTRTSYIRPIIPWHVVCRTLHPPSHGDIAQHLADHDRLCAQREQHNYISRSSPEKFGMTFPNNAWEHAERAPEICETEMNQHFGKTLATYFHVINTTQDSHTSNHNKLHI